MANEYYKSEEELMYACADAMREEYKAIIDAGLSVQLDDPAFAENWDQSKKEPSVEGYRRYTEKCVEILNYALRGLPEEKIRFHLCWGSWHGPHTTDIPMKHLVDLMLKVNAGWYSFEAANARHGHEWKLWKEIELPAGKVIMPGIVSHSTNLIEHPELVADRIINFAEAVGRENVVASTDCGLGGRVHPQIAWAKLRRSRRARPWPPSASGIEGVPGRLRVASLRHWRAPAQGASLRRRSVARRIGAGHSPR